MNKRATSPGESGTNPRSNGIGRTERLRESLKEVNGQLLFGPTKTHTVRTVSLPAFLRELLATPGPGGAGPDALVFTTETGASLRGVNFSRRHYRPAVAAALAPEKHALRFHDLRHTCVSLLVAAGIHPKAIQQHLGHSSIQVTLDRYAHLLPSVEAALAAALDATHATAASKEGEVVALPHVPGSARVRGLA